MKIKRLADQSERALELYRSPRKTEDEPGKRCLALVQQESSLQIEGCVLDLLIAGLPLATPAKAGDFALRLRVGKTRGLNVEVAIQFQPLRDDFLARVKIQLRLEAQGAC